MKYALFPKETKQMLRLCKPGNFIFEVTIRYSDASVGWSLSQYPSAEEAERAQLSHKNVRAAVARQIILEVV